MKKRSKLIMVISVVLVVALLATMFVGCKKKEEEPDPTPAPELKATEVLDAAVEAYQGAGFLETALSTMRLDFNLGVEGSVNGGETKKYNMSVKMGLDLVNSWTKGYGNNYIDIICKDGDTQTLRFQYVNSKLKDDQLGAWAEGKAKVADDYAYLFAGDKAFKIKVPNVAVSLRYEMMNGGIGINPSAQEITDKKYKHWISDQDIQDFLNDQLPGYLNMAVGLIGKNPALDTDAGTGSFEVPLSALLAPEGELGGVLAEFSGVATQYLDMVGLKDNTLDALIANVLPYINLNVAFTGLNGDTAPTTTISANVGDDTKGNNITIAMKDDETKGIFFKAPKCEGKLVMDVNVGETAQYYTALTAAEKEKAAKNTINALNLNLAGTFELLGEKAFQKEVGPLKIDVKPGKYTWSIKADVNPGAFLGGRIDFTNKTTLVPNMLAIVKDNLIDFLEVKLLKEGEAAPALDITVRKNASKQLEGWVSAEGILGITGLGTPDSPLQLGTLIDLVKDMIDKANNDSATATSTMIETAAEGSTTVDPNVANTLKDVKKSLLALVLNVDLKTAGSEYAEGSFAATKYAVAMSDGNFDEAKLSLTIAAKKVRIDKNGLVATEFHIFNDGTSLKPADKIDINFNFAVTTVEYGTALGYKA